MSSRSLNKELRVITLWCVLLSSFLTVPTCAEKPACIAGVITAMQGRWRAEKGDNRRTLKLGDSVESGEKVLPTSAPPSAIAIVLGNGQYIHSQGKESLTIPEFSQSDSWWQHLFETLFGSKGAWVIAAPRSRTPNGLIEGIVKDSDALDFSRVIEGLPDSTYAARVDSVATGPRSSISFMIDKHKGLATANKPIRPGLYKLTVTVQPENRETYVLIAEATNYERFSKLLAEQTEKSSAWAAQPLADETRSNLRRALLRSLSGQD